MKHQVRVTQTFHVTRVITLEVEAPDRESAVEEQAANEAPDFNDPRWLTGWNLMNEEVA